MKWFTCFYTKERYRDINFNASFIEIQCNIIIGAWVWITNRKQGILVQVSDIYEWSMDEVNIVYISYECECNEKIPLELDFYTSCLFSFMKSLYGWFLKMAVF